MKGKRDRALLAVLLACGLRRHEAASLDFGHVQQREDHWAIVDLKGKAGHTRTVPMPGWVKALLDDWVHGANLTAGRLFRRVNKNEKAWGDGLTEKAVWHVVREYAREAVLRSWHLTISGGHVPGCATRPAGNWNRSNSSSGTLRFRRPSDTSAAGNGLGPP